MSESFAHGDMEASTGGDGSRGKSWGGGTLFLKAIRELKLLESLPSAVWLAQSGR